MTINADNTTCAPSMKADTGATTAKQPQESCCCSINSTVLAATAASEVTEDHDSPSHAGNVEAVASDATTLPTDLGTMEGSVVQEVPLETMKCTVCHKVVTDLKAVVVEGGVVHGTKEKIDGVVEHVCSACEKVLGKWKGKQENQKDAGEKENAGETEVSVA